MKERMKKYLRGGFGKTIIFIIILANICWLLANVKPLWSSTFLCYVRIALLDMMLIGGCVLMLSILFFMFEKVILKLVFIIKKFLKLLAHRKGDSC